MQIYHISRDIIALALFHGAKMYLHVSRPLTAILWKKLDSTSKVFRDHEYYLL